MMRPDRCPRPERLDDYFEGRADPCDFVELEGHIGRCEQCRQVVAALARQPCPRRGDEAAR